MRKRMLLSILLCSLLTIFLAVSGITPAQANIHSGPTWVGPQYDKDDFHGITTTFVAFTTDTNATLKLTVRNDLSPAQPLNISAVKVLMDWNVNYSSTEASQSSPRVITKYNSTYGIYYYYTFTITFKVPAITTASNMFKHYYWVYVEEVNATTGAQRVKIHAMTSGSDFIVYSSDQVAAQNSRIEYTRLNFTSNPTSKTALELWKSASVEYNAGRDSYKSGDFSGAKTHYGAALTLLKSARSTEETYQTTVQENTLAYQEALTKQAEANATAAEGESKYYEGLGSYYNKTGDAAVTEAEAAMIEANATMKIAEAQWMLAQAASLQSTALNLFGFGFILFGVAAIIWAFKRPKPPPPS